MSQTALILLYVGGILAALPSIARIAYVEFNDRSPLGGGDCFLIVFFSIIWPVTFVLALLAASIYFVSEILPRWLRSRNLSNPFIRFFNWMAGAR